MEQVIELTLANLIPDLRDRLAGSVYLPSEQGFMEAKSGWNLRVQHQPAVIVAAQNEADVQAAIRFANRLNLPIAVQSTGHGQFRTCEGGLLLNISALNQVEIDPHRKTATVGGGTRWFQVIQQAGPFNLMPVSGSSPSVGVVGYTVGGGYGILSRKYGLGVDQVLSMRLIDPEGNLRVVSPIENEDLYWAILGGGGSFGVITQMEIRLHDQPAIFGGSVMFDASLARDIFPAFLRFTKQAPEDVASALTMIQFPPMPAIPEFLHGRTMIVFNGAALGENGADLLAPIRSLPGAEFDTFQPMAYADTHAVFSDPVDPLPVTARGALIRELEEADLTSVLDAIGEPSQAANLLFRIRHYGAAISRGGKFQNSIGQQRQAKYLMYFLGVPMGRIDIEKMHEEAKRVFAAIEPQVLSRGPLNWLGEADVTGKAVQGTFSPDEYARQLQVKKTIDPNNRFAFAGVGLS